MSASTNQTLSQSFASAWATHQLRASGRIGQPRPVISRISMPRCGGAGHGLDDGRHERVLNVARNKSGSQVQSSSYLQMKGAGTGMSARQMSPGRLRDPFVNSPARRI